MELVATLLTEGALADAPLPSPAKAGEGPGVRAGRRQRMTAEPHASSTPPLHANQCRARKQAVASGARAVSEATRVAPPLHASGEGAGG